MREQDGRSLLLRAAEIVVRDGWFDMRSSGHDVRGAVLEAASEVGWDEWLMGTGHGLLGHALGLGHEVGHALFTGPRYMHGTTGEEAVRVLRLAAGEDVPVEGEWMAMVAKAMERS